MVLTWLFLVFCVLRNAHAQSKKPNIVFIVADDLGFNDVGWNNKYIKTPNMDKLANAGVIMDQAYAQPVCTPSRSAFMTGYYPYKIGMGGSPLSGTEAYGLPLTKTLLPEQLKKLGYSTHMVGKWHLGYCSWKLTPTERGFDSFYGFYLASQDYYTHMTGARVKGLDLRSNKTVVRDKNGVYDTTLFSDEAIKVINHHDKTNPMFLYIAYNAPHTPLQVPDKYKQMYPSNVADNRRTYAGMVTAMDEGIGNVTKALEAQGMLENTIIVFTSDNGGASGNMRNPGQASNLPLRGGKGTLWEGGTRVPAFVYGKNIKKKAYRNSRLFHLTDWYPTFVNLAGGKTDSKLDGINQWSAINENAETKRTEFVYNINTKDDLSAIRVGDYKLISGNISPRSSSWTRDSLASGFQRLPCPRSSSLRQMNGVKTMLFNLKDDPSECYNLASKLPKVVSELQAKLAAYEKREVLRPESSPVPKARPSNYGGVYTPGWCSVGADLGIIG